MVTLFKEHVDCDRDSGGGIPIDVLDFLIGFWTKGEVGEITFIFFG